MNPSPASLHSRRVSRCWRLLPLLAAIALPTLPLAADEPIEEPLVVFLVRHAEKVDDSSDPPLSHAGVERAQQLAYVLVDAGIDHVLSSDFIRTRDTATPLAEELGLDVELYDPRNLNGLAQRIEGATGRYLVVGHSNTTPVLVELLGGEPGSAIDEASEYDRLYLVTIQTDGTVSSVLLRFGAPYAR